MMMTNGDNSLPVTDYIMGVSFGLAFGALVTAVFYSTGILASIRKDKEKRRRMKIIAAIGVAVCVVLLVASIAASVYN